jgi:FRG domain-containing protein
VTDPSAISNPDSPVQTVHCETPEQFLDALSRRRYKFRGTLPRQWIFRGHSDDAYQLTPSALRNNSQQLIERSNHPITDSKTQRFLEICELDEFFKTADSIGLALPEDTQLLRNYLKRARHESDVWPQEQVLSLMALAQHHGVPTRLLDWSRHPLKAALFAASGAAKDADKTGRLSVWAFSLDLFLLCTWSTPSQMSRSSPPFVLVTAPSATNSNLHAQEGVFTLAQSIQGDKSPVDRRSLDNVLGEWIKKCQASSSIGWFHRVTLPKSQADNLCWELAHEGITQATLSPNFYGVVAAMNDMNRWMRPGGPGYPAVPKP